MPKKPSLKTFSSLLVSGTVSCLTNPDFLKSVTSQQVPPDVSGAGLGLTQLVIGSLINTISGSLASNAAAKLIDDQHLVRWLCHEQPGGFNVHLELLIKKASYRAFLLFEKLFEAEVQELALWTNYDDDQKTEYFLNLRKFFRDAKKEVRTELDRLDFKTSDIYSPDIFLNGICEYILLAPRTVFFDQEAKDIFTSFYRSKMPFCFELAFKDEIVTDEPGFKAFELCILEGIKQSNASLTARVNEMMGFIQKNKPVGDGELQRQMKLQNDEIRKIIGEGLVGFDSSISKILHSALLTYISIEQLAQQVGEMSSALNAVSSIAADTLHAVREVREKASDSGYPKFLGIVPSRSDEFIGREEDLRKLFDAVISSKKIVFVNGVGGIGKTSLVKTFIERFAGEFDHFAWIGIGKSDEPGEKPKESQLESHFIPLGIFLNGGKVNSDLNLAQQFEHTVGVLSNIRGRNLLVIDNFGEEIIPYRNNLPGAPYWKIIVTGRASVPGLKNFPLGRLNNVDAVALFKLYCLKPVDAGILMSFLKEIDFHTLMIEISAKTLNDGADLSLSDLLAHLKEGTLDNEVLDQFIVTEHGQEGGRLVRHLLMLLNRSSLRDEEVGLLKLWYYLAPDSYTSSQIVDFLGKSIRSEELIQSLKSLAVKGWLIFNSHDRTYSTHRLIQQSIRYCFNPNLNTVIPLMQFITAELTDEMKDLNELVLQQLSADHIFNHSRKEDRPNPYLAYMLSAQADAYERHGYVKFAYSYFQKSVDVYKALTEINNDIFGPLFRHFSFYKGRASLLNTDYVRAKVELLEALELCKFKFTDDEDLLHSDHVNICERLSDAYRQLGDVKNARKFQNKSLSLQRKRRNKNKREALFYAESRIQKLISDGDFKGALPIAGRYFTSCQKEFSAGRMDLLSFAKKVNNHGFLLEKIGRYREAFDLYNQAADLFGRLVVTMPLVYDMEFANSLACLGRVTTSMGEIEFSNASYEKVIDVYLRNLQGRPYLWKDIISFAICLTYRYEKPLADSRREMLKNALVKMYIYAPRDSKERESFLLSSAEAMELSVEEFIEFLNSEVIPEAQRVIEEARAGRD
jgi:tetratricopeptide (TPR) repeat protein